MNKKFLTILSVGILGTFLLPFSVFGALTYNRIPTGFTIENPVIFNINGVFEEYPSVNSWYLTIRNGNDASYGVGGCNTSTSAELIDNLPITDYNLVKIIMWTDTACTQSPSNYLLEYDSGNLIFEVIEPEILVGVIQAGFDENMPDYDLSNATAYIGGLIDATGGLIWLFIGIPLGFYVIKKVIDIIKLKTIKVRK